MRAFFLAVILVLLFPLKAMAFGNVGHLIVCEIAFNELNVKARIEVARLIGIDPEIDRFNESCLWPDRVRNSSHRHTRTWHYVNFDETDTTVDQSDCAQSGCLLSAIELHEGVLADASQAESDRLEALKFLAHWYGDLHQPLHLSFASDSGGNGISVRWRDRKNSNLHAVWDTEMIVDHARDRYAGVRAYKRWYPLAQELLGEISDSDRTAWRQGTVIDWANESYGKTRESSVRYLGADETIVLQLGDAYYNQHKAHILLRLKQAGVRLGVRLNDLLGQ